MNKELRKALAKYRKAEWELIKVRDKLFPAGCTVTDGGWVNGEVQSLSYYADRVRVRDRHTSLYNLKRVEETKDE